MWMYLPKQQNFGAMPIKKNKNMLDKSRREGVS